MNILDNVFFQKPDTIKMAQEGLTCIDMHHHTRFSDTFTRIGWLMKRCRKMDVGVAITDHNEIGGVTEAFKKKKDVPVIPGIEVSIQEGPHYLLYFYSTSELSDFYEKFIASRKRKNPYVAINLSTEQMIDALKDYNCIRTVAHPYSIAECGYMNAVNRNYIDIGHISDFDAIEVINAVHLEKQNRMAVDLAQSKNMMFVGGSDAHSMFNLGEVVTVSESSEVDSFLDSIRKKENMVVGRTTPMVNRALPYGQMATNHMRYFRHTIPIKFNSFFVKPVKVYYGPMMQKKMTEVKDVGVNGVNDIMDFGSKNMHKIRKKVKDVVNGTGD